MMAKSPRRRATSMKQAPERGGATGSSTSISISSGASAVVSAPTKKSAASIQRSPRTDCARSLAAEREHDGRHFGGRIGMREVAADGAAVADLRMRDVRQRLVDERQVARGGGVALEVAIARQRTDAQAFARRSSDPGAAPSAD